MALNPQKGNMYDFVTHTWNPISGVCFHNCSYCYMKPISKESEPTLKEHIFNDKFVKNSFIFIGSSTDMFAENVPSEWITRVLDHCKDEIEAGRGKAFLLQTKNPQRFFEFTNHPIIKKRCVLATTIESNLDYPEIMNNAPKMEERVKAMEKLSKQGFTTMVTAEPLMDFDLEQMVEYMERCSPKRINIGRNTSKTVTIPEPTKEKVQELYERLKSSPTLQSRGTKIEFKSNANAWR